MSHLRKYDAYAICLFYITNGLEHLLSFLSFCFCQETLLAIQNQTEMGRYKFVALIHKQV